MWVCPPSWKAWGPYYSLSISQEKKWRDHSASISCTTRCHEVNICLSLPGSSTGFSLCQEQLSSLASCGEQGRYGSQKGYFALSCPQWQLGLRFNACKYQGTQSLGDWHTRTESFGGLGMGQGQSSKVEEG